MGYYVLCDYDEPDEQTYRGIVVIDTLTNQEAHRFYSGDYEQDFQHYQRWLADMKPYFYEGESMSNFVNDLQNPNENETFS
ncbi:hypothetical protein [Pseudalkalibacillus sp. SCS-8]|uniref:hypothetical protein n=1 Tax=Pseudalkalibacillus nanhaiensis TaxID=3115291 RepID=UPI0032D9F04C